MTDTLTETSTIGEGWYTDPHDAARLRWWDGAGWTDALAPAAAAAAATQLPVATELPDATELPVATEPTAAPEPVVQYRSRRELREAEAVARGEVVAPAPSSPVSVTPPASTEQTVFSMVGADVVTGIGAAAGISVGLDAAPLVVSLATRPDPRHPDALDLSDDRGSVSFLGTETPPRRAEAPPTTVHTSGVWVLAALPLALLAVQFTLVFALLDAYVQPIPALVGLLFLVATVFAARADARALRTDAHPRVASVWWVALSPLAYLIARVVRVKQSVGRTTFAPLVIWSLSIALPLMITVAFGSMLLVAQLTI